VDVGWIDAVEITGVLVPVGSAVDEVHAMTRDARPAVNSW
jgi:hypothetical protein